MEETKPFVISKEVVKIAFERVKANKGVNGIILCRKMAKKNIVFPTYFLYLKSVI